MKKSIIILLFVICLNITACSYYEYEQEITKLFFVEEYAVHEAGVEVWAKTETEENVGIFVKHENIYPCEEETSRVVALYCQHGNLLTDEYLYFSEEDFIEYIKEKYDIE